MSKRMGAKITAIPNQSQRDARPTGCRCRRYCRCEGDGERGLEGSVMDAAIVSSLSALAGSTWPDRSSQRWRAKGNIL